MQHNIHSLIACRTGVIFCVFQGNRGESEAYAKRELRAWEPPLARNSRFAHASHFALASHLPRLRPCSPEIRKTHVCSAGYSLTIEIRVTLCFQIATDGVECGLDLKDPLKFSRSLPHNYYLVVHYHTHKLSAQMYLLNIKLAR